MIVLGFDTATPATAVGLRLADGAVLQARHDPQAGERPGHSTHLLPLAEDLLAQAGLDWGSIERLAVGVGPGTFTGLRIGVATARGLAQSLAVELVGVGSLRALAHAVAEVWKDKGDVLAVIDARRGQTFLGAYSSGGAISIRPRVLAPEDIGRLLAQAGPSDSAPGDPDFGPGDPDFGPGDPDSGPGGPDSAPGPPGPGPQEGRSWLAVGDGAVRYRSLIEPLGVAVPEDSSSLHRVEGVSICALALDSPPSEPDSVLPDYLRLADAEIALQGAAG